MNWTNDQEQCRPSKCTDHRLIIGSRTDDYDDDESEIIIDLYFAVPTLDNFPGLFLCGYAQVRRT